MKWFLVFLFILLAAASFPLILFMNFDAERLRPGLEDYVSDAFDAAADFGTLRFHASWNPEIEIQDLQMTAVEGGEWTFQVPEVRLKVSLPAFLRRRIEVSTAEILKASVRIQKRVSPGEARERAPAASEKTDGINTLPFFWLEGGDWPFHVQTFDFRGAEITYEDSGSAPVFKAEMKSTDLIFLSTDTPNIYQVQGQTEALWLPDPDVSFQGVLDIGKKAFFITASTGEQEWMFEGAVSLRGSSIETQGQLNIYGYGLDLPYIQGLLTAEIDGIIEGSNPEQWQKTLAVKGAVDLREGVYSPINLIKSALDNSAAVIQESLREPLLRPDWNISPASGEGTAFSLLQANVEVFHGSLFVRQGLIKHGDYLMEIDGSFNLLLKEADLKAKLVFLEEATRALVKTFPHFEILKNEYGRLVIPFRYNGLLPQAVVKPDRDYLQMRTLSGIAMKKEKDNAAEPQASSPAGESGLEAAAKEVTQ